MGGNPGEVQIGSERELYNKYINHQAGTIYSMILLHCSIQVIPTDKEGVLLFVRSHVPTRTFRPNRFDRKAWAGLSAFRF